jgi:phosphatidylglycerol:prolipoprotein diacylglycerol transferase
MLPKLFSTGDFFLPTYGLLVALGVLLGLMVTTRLGRRKGMDPEKITNLVLYVVFAGMIGAKLAMFLFDWQYYAQRPQEIFTLSTLQAAGVFQGGLVLSLIVAWWYVRREKLAFLPVADVFAPGLALGHAVGRIGCFAAGCCYGAYCERPWAVRYTNPDAAAISGTPLGVPLHPTQLYESVAELVLFAALYRMSSQPHRPGTLIGVYLTVYSLVRFLVEFVRHHEQSLQGGLSLTQWMSLGFAMAGAVYLWRASKAKSAPAVPES